MAPPAKKPAAKKTVAKKKTAAKKPAAKKTVAKKKAATVKPAKAPLTLDSLTEMEDEAAAPLEVEKPTPEAAPVAVKKKAVVVKSDEDLVDRLPQTKGSAVAGKAAKRDVTAFMRQLLMLLEAGTPILKSLKTLSTRARTEAARGLIADIADFVEQGNPLWQAFDRHPKYFDTVEVNLIKASEASGTLTTVLNRIADTRDSQALLERRVKGAMIYPVVILAACFGVLIILTWFVVPQFEQIFAQFGNELPKVTKVFLAASNFCGDYLWVPFVLIILFLVFYKGWYVRNPVRRINADKWKLKIPYLGSILQKKALVELTQTWAMLLRSGVSMMASLDLTRNAVTNKAIGETLQSVRDSIEQGGSIEEPLRGVPHLIPPEVTDMLVTGEESGRVDSIAEHIATTKEEEVKISVANLSENLQPIFTIVVGIAVMFLFIALFYPILGLMDATQSGV